MPTTPAGVARNSIVIMSFDRRKGSIADPKREDRITSWRASQKKPEATKCPHLKAQAQRSEAVHEKKAASGRRAPAVERAALVRIASLSSSPSYHTPLSLPVILYATAAAEAR